MPGKPFLRSKELGWRIAAWALVAFPMVIILCIVQAFRGSCWDERTDSKSPDSTHVARSVVHFCQRFGPDVRVTQFIEITKADGSGSAKIFESDMGGSALAHWSNNQNLAVEINGKSAVVLSLHAFDGVHITYFVPQALIIPSFSDTQIEELHRAGKLKYADYETMKKGNQFWREWEERFLGWASKNATIVQK
jgi:hypothetical protein